MTKTAHCICQLCQHSFPKSQVVPWIAVRPGVSALIKAELPDWQEGSFICRPDLARFRRRYVETLLSDERGELSALDRDVVDSLANGQIISRSPSDVQTIPATFGERTADYVAEFGGSWTFILSFGAVLVVWITINAIGLMVQPFDPYPFILLNLVLSCLAALQAPIIMMSQRRQETKDRLRAENDYRVNLKAELEIRQLHEKLDHQLMHQWEKLATLQQIQIDLLEERTTSHGKN